MTRLFIIVLLTWVIGAIIGSFEWGLFYALAPFIFWEMLRRR
jgi:hypothetical protein